MPVIRIEPHNIDVTGTAPIPPELPGEVLVEVSHLGICGTDVELLHDNSYYMQQGLAAYPIIFGHEWTGTVVAVSSGVNTVTPGDTVVGQTVVTCGACTSCQAGMRSACEHHQEVGLLGRQDAAAQYVSMPASALTVLPAGTSLRDAVLIEPGVTAMNAVAKTDVRFDDRVAIIGTGALGLLAVAIATRITSHVDAIGIDDAGLEAASQMGVKRTLSPDRAVPNSYTVVIEASGHPDSVAMMGKILRPGGRGALVGVVNRGTPNFEPAFITLKGITLFGIFHGLDHYGRVAELLAEPDFPADLLIDRVIPWERAEEAFGLLAKRQLVRPKIMLDLTSMGAR